MLVLLGRKRTIILCSILAAVFIVDLIFCIVKGPNGGEGVGTELAEKAQDLFIFHIPFK